MWTLVVDFADENDAKDLLHEAVEACFMATKLWSKLAKLEEKHVACAILNKVKLAIPNSELILLASFEMDFKNRDYVPAMKLLKKARESGGLPKGWMNSSILERR